MELASLQKAATRPGIIGYALRALLILFGLLLIFSYAYTVFASLTSGRYDPRLISSPIIIVISLFIGWRIDRKHAGHRIALLFLLMGYCSAVMLIANGMRELSAVRPALFSPAANSIVLVLHHTFWIPEILISLFLIPLYFPDGKLLSPRLRPIVAIILGGMVWMILAIVLRPWPWLLNGVPDTRALNGIAGSEAFFDASMIVFGVIMVPAILLAIASCFLRYHRAQGVEREQMKWPVLAFLVILCVASVASLIPELRAWEPDQGYPITLMMVTLLPISIGVAILHHRLFNINIAISRTLLYGGLTAMIVALYVAIVGLLGFLFQAQTNVYSGLAAAAIIAVLFQPLRDRLQRQVDRLLFGERDDPAAVLARLAQQTQTDGPPSAILPNLVETIAQTLKLPYVAIWRPADPALAEPVAAWGNAPSQTESLPLIYRQKTIGHLVAGWRDPQEPFGDQEQMLLAAMAAITATTVHATQLSDELRRSRRNIVSAREDERRRLRRDLHDGLGPQLASQTLGLEAVAQLMPNDPQKAQQLLLSLMKQAEEATQDVRRLVYDLRPPALDDLGLLGALQQRAARYEVGVLRFHFLAADSLPMLPAAVETAVYRIAQEAMTNVVRHAGATRCDIHLFCQGEALIIEIRDNGRGLPAGYRPGVGLHAMGERTAELDGQLILESVPNGGTLVRARLPLEINGV